ncbi:AAA family ATPase [Vagococcus coleopterorum]|uniref:AAA family ATPase n=1 Tax=Vagococcus coleopterorum TaxID=2714946 RepID=A0A6G8ALP4_9ENTE|nr:retron Eco8 family effector endonuclease [Vagococcus coleopterorum]QIL45843.1 AAA family ATPase [Vagococcus coleopterorum]
MTIKRVSIKNFKSIDSATFDLNDLNAFVGKNGTGKTTILKAIEYFFDNLIDLNISNDIFDSNSLYHKPVEISIEFDFSRILKYSSGVYEMKLFSMMLFNAEKYIVTMKQEKNKLPEWNIGYDERYIIYNSHPVYFCDTRSISLTDWSEIWNVVGDLINAKDAREITREISDNIAISEFSKFKKYSNIVNSFMEENGLTIKSDNKKDSILKLLQQQLGGMEFIKQGKELEYYSDGTNSLNYILFLCYIGFEISNNRLKDVTILLDEPEQGLHPKMVDELMYKINSYSKKVVFVIFTHSPRILTSLMNKGGTLYRVRVLNDHMMLNKMYGFSDEREQFFISDRESSCFFSDFILCVEGVTEIELFSHKLLRELFPVLFKVDIVNVDSNDVVLKLFYKTSKKTGLPILVLNDLDKFITFTEESNKYQMKYKRKTSYSPFKTMDEQVRKLKLSISKDGNKQQISQLKNLLKLNDKEFVCESKFDSIPEFDEVFKDIQQILMRHDILATRTTIEGSIINIKTNKWLLRWLRDEYEIKFNYEKGIEASQKVAINRLLLNGKTDMLLSIKHIPEVKKDDYFSNKQTFKKTSGWVTEFLNYYSEKVMGQKQYMNKNGLNMKRKRFENDFPEIYAIIKIIESKLNSK